jgi:hypothetical protein
MLALLQNWTEGAKCITGDLMYKYRLCVLLAGTLEKGNLCFELNRKY